MRGHSDGRESGQDAPPWTGFLLALGRVSPLIIIGVVACLVVGRLAAPGALGAHAAPTSQARAAPVAPRAEPTPALIDVLRAADALNKAGLLSGQASVTPRAEPTPALIDVLRAADALNKAGLLPVQVGVAPRAEPTPALIDVLRAADALNKAGLLPGQASAPPRAEPTPVLIDVLRAADELNRAGLLPGQASGAPRAEPTPALIDVLRAADALQQAGLLPSQTAPHRALEQPVSAQRGARPDVVFFGDSVTVGAGAGDTDRGFVSILRERLSAESRLGSSQVIVSAFGGLHGDLENTRAVLRERPGLVVVEVGAHSALEDQATPIATFRSAYGLMLDCLQGSGAVVVVGTTAWLHWPGDDPAYARASAISQVIREEAAKRGIPVADIWDAMKDRPAYISPDGIHPNDVGHEMIADLYWRQIEPQMSVPPHVSAAPCSVPPAPLPRRTATDLLRDLLRLLACAAASIHALDGVSVPLR